MKIPLSFSGWGMIPTTACRQWPNVTFFCDIIAEWSFPRYCIFLSAFAISSDFISAEPIMPHISLLCGRFFKNSYFFGFLILLAAELMWVCNWEAASFQAVLLKPLG